MTRTTRTSLGLPSACLRYAFLALFPALTAACGADGRMGTVGGDTGDSGVFLPPVAVADSGSTAPPPADDCQDGEEGCPCKKSGHVATCGIVHFKSGVYAGCDPGISRCLEDKTWGPCFATGLPMKPSKKDDKH